MTNHIVDKTVRFLSAAGMACGISCAQAANMPDPLLDETQPAQGTSGTIVLAGGCFWGVQAVFQHVKGVSKVISGYSGGAADTAHYDMVSEGTTGHAESVEVTYNPAEISAGKLLQVFFFVAHDPTTLNRQGPDTGTQYRSAIFFTSAEQEKIAKEYINQINAAKSFSAPIVTEMAELKSFYPAEAYHQDYARIHPDNPYIAIHDLPKVANLKSKFPAIYTEGK